MCRCTYIHECVCVFVCVDPFWRISEYMHVCTYRCTHSYKFINSFTYMYICRGTCVHAHMFHEHTHTNTTYTHILTRLYTHTHTRILTHMHTHISMSANINIKGLDESSWSGLSNHLARDYCLYAYTCMYMRVSIHIFTCT